MTAMRPLSSPNGLDLKIPFLSANWLDHLTTTLFGTKPFRDSIILILQFPLDHCKVVRWETD